MDMFKCVSADSVYADMMMQKSNDARIFLLLEGPEDCRTLDPHLSEDACQIFIGEGRSNVLGAMDILSKNPIDGIFALVDSDHSSGFIDERLQLPNVIATEMNDLDSEIMRIPGLVERVCFSHADGPGLRRRLREAGFLTVISALDSIVHPVAALQLHCSEYDLAFSSRNFPVVNNYQKGLFALNQQRFCASAAARVSGCKVSSEWVMDWLSGQGASSGVSSIHSNGHHLFDALHAVLKHEAGYKYRVETIENSVRSAASSREILAIRCIQLVNEKCEARGVWIWREGRDQLALAS